MKTFEDLKFKEHPMCKGAREACNAGIDMEEYTKAKQAVIELSDTITLSVVFGTVFYSNGKDSYEAMVLGGESEPRGYLTSSQVTEYMKELQGESNE